jgi:hypothetical protein
MKRLIHHRWVKQRNRIPRSRSGAVLVVALVCLLIVMSLLGSMLQGALRAQRQLHSERDRRQTELLLAAGADRAAVLLSTQPDYRGDTWHLPAASITGRGTGQVITTIARQSDDQPWEVRVVAEYPLGGDLSIRRSRTFLLTAPTAKIQE